MDSVDDIRKLLEEMVVPDLKAIQAQIARDCEPAKLRGEALAPSVEVKFDLLLARMDANHAVLMHAITLDQRLRKLEYQAMARESAA